MAEARREERRQEILMAALQAFSTRGYDKTSMDDIVEASGLSKGTLYWHFKSKESIFAGLVQMFSDELIATFDAIVTQVEQQSPVEAVRLIYTSTIDLIESNPVFASLTADFYLQAMHHQSIWERLTRYYEDYVTRLSKVIADGVAQGVFREVDANATAAAIVSGLDGLAMMGSLQNHPIDGFANRVDIRKAVETAADITIAGLLKERRA